MTRPIRALTILQPWCSLITHGPKRVENRTWPPHGLKVGDYLALHAGKAIDLDTWAGAIATARAAGLLGTLPVLDGLLALPKPAPGDRFARARAKAYFERACPYGAVIGVAQLVGIETEAPDADDPWWFGPFGWRLDHVVAIEPVPCSGAQGLWTLPDDVLALVRQRFTDARKGTQTAPAEVPAAPANVTPLRCEVVCKVCLAKAPALYRDPSKAGIVCCLGGTIDDARQVIAEMPAAHFAPCGRACVNGDELPAGGDEKRMHMGRGCKVCKQLRSDRMLGTDEVWDANVLSR